MKTFVVTAEYTTSCTIEVEAENEEHAMELAKDIDGGEFIPQDNLFDSDWNIARAEEKQQSGYSDFLKSIFESANKFYEPIAGTPLPKEVTQTFIDLGIRDLDGLSDDGSEFDELEYQAFEDALETHDAIERRDQMETGGR